uniref:Uncharacterized protein n=1 Tax=Columba livia TaxID=8932 RepID=R7VSV9_COLLI
MKENLGFCPKMKENFSNSPEKKNPTNPTQGESATKLQHSGSKWVKKGKINAKSGIAEARYGKKLLNAPFGQRGQELGRKRANQPRDQKSPFPPQIAAFRPQKMPRSAPKTPRSAPKRVSLSFLGSSKPFCGSKRHRRKRGEKDQKRPKMTPK